MKVDIRLTIFTILSLLIIIFGIVVIATKPSTPVGYFVKITSDLIKDITSDLIKDITARFLKITGKPTATASFEVITAAPYLSQNIPNQTWDEDTNISINLSLYFSDPNNDDLSFTYNDSFSNFGGINLIIDNLTNLANFTPNKNWYGTGYIIFIATDGSLTNQSNNVTLNVTSVNDAPVFNGTNILNRTWDEDTNLTHIFNISGYFSDVENDSLIFSATGNSSIKIEINNGNISLFPNKNWYGTEYVIFTANDGTNTTNSNNVTLTVYSVPDVNMTRFNCSTTDLSSLNSTQLQSLDNFILEICEYGKIIFNQTINLTSDIDFDTYVNISDNLISINTITLSELNKSATLWFYNLTFSDPQILRDNEVCSSTVCEEISYSAGTFIFNVSHFATYTTRETPVEEEEAPAPVAEAAAAAGGGGGAARASTFRVSKDLIKVVVAPGIKKTVEFNVKNLGIISRDYTIEIEGVEEFVKIEEKSFSLEPAESKDIKAVIEVPEDIELDVYTGSSIVKSALIFKKINVIIEVQSAEPLFDVDIDVLKTHKKVSSGAEVLAQVIIYDLKEFGEVDVNVYYLIKDMKGNKIIVDKDIVTIDTIAEFIKSITLPKIEPGSYVFAVKVVYQGSVGTSTDVFEVTPITELAAPILIKKFAPINMVIWLGALLIITLITLVILDIIKKIDVIISVKKKKIVLEKKEKKKRREGKEGEKKKKKKSLLKKWIKKIKRKRAREKKIKEKEKRRERERKRRREEREREEKERERRREERRKRREWEMEIEKRKREKEEKEREHRREEKYREEEKERKEKEKEKEEKEKKRMKEEKRIRKEIEERKRREKEGKEKERRKEERKRREKGKERKEREREENKIIKEKIEKKLNLLTKAYESKYISKEAYQKDKNKLKKKLKKINKFLFFYFFIFFLILIITPFVYSELININVKVHDISKHVHPGDEVFVQLSLVNLAMDKGDITIEYYIDKDENIIDMESETVLLTTRIDRVRSLELPETIELGRYSFIVKVIYKEKVIGTASDVFYVIEPMIIETPALIKENFLYILIIIIVVFLIILIGYIYYILFKLKKKK